MRPSLQPLDKRVAQGVLCQVEVTQDADENRQDAAVLGAEAGGAPK